MMKALCFTPGALVDLDLPSVSLHRDYLMQFPPSQIAFAGIALCSRTASQGCTRNYTKAKQVELLVRLGASPDLVRSQLRPASVALRANYLSLCAPPHRLGTACDDPATEQLPTRAGVVAPTMVLLSALGTGSFWCIVHSKGGGW